MSEEAFLRRTLSVKPRPKTEKAISDAERVRKEMEASGAAALWKKGFDAETRQ